jgi:hypothetical protein
MHGVFRRLVTRGTHDFKSTTSIPVCIANAMLCPYHVGTFAAHMSDILKGVTIEAEGRSYDGI